MSLQGTEEAREPSAPPPPPPGCRHCPDTSFVLPERDRLPGCKAPGPLSPHPGGAPTGSSPGEGPGRAEAGDHCRLSAGELGGSWEGAWILTLPDSRRSSLLLSCLSSLPVELHLREKVGHRAAGLFNKCVELESRARNLICTCARSITCTSCVLITSVHVCSVVLVPAYRRWRSPSPCYS